MKCSQCQELLSPYLDGVLTDRECRVLEIHLNSCVECRYELEALRKTVGLLQAWSEEELDLPEGFEERMRRRLSQAGRPPWYLRMSKSWMSLSVAAAIIILVVFSANADYFVNNLNYFAQRHQTLKSEHTQQSDDTEQVEDAANFQKMAPVGEKRMATEPETQTQEGDFEAAAAGAPVLETAASELQPVPAAPNDRAREMTASGVYSSRHNDIYIEEEEEEEEPEDLTRVFFQADWVDPGGLKDEEIALTFKAVPGSTFGKGQVTYEIALWAEQNSKQRGVFNKKFDGIKAFLVSAGEIPGSGYKVTFQEIAMDQTGVLVVDVRFKAPVTGEEVVPGERSPYEVFSVPTDIPVRVRIIDEKGELLEPAVYELL